MEWQTISFLQCQCLKIPEGQNIMHSLQSPSWLLWNLFLAVSSVPVGYLLSWWGADMYKKVNTLVWFLILAVLSLSWMAFLPNSCYLITEWRHLFFDRTLLQMRIGAVSGMDQLSVARIGLFFLLYSLIGVFLFGASIRPVDRMLRVRGVHPGLLAIPFFFLISLGVYLGLIVRLNSWKIVTNPMMVVHVSQKALESNVLLRVIAIFAVLLWVLYEGVDIFFMGLSVKFGHPASNSAGARKKHS